jgi:hypothetical protein
MTVALTMVSGNFSTVRFHSINILFSPEKLQDSYILELLVLDAGRGLWF